MPLPTERRFMQKFWQSLRADRDLAKAYYKRFGVESKREQAIKDKANRSFLALLNNGDREELERAIEAARRRRKTPQEQQITDKLSYYGGYRIRRRLIGSVPIEPHDQVLDIGPEMGMECFLLAEVYNRVAVAEPDTETHNLLRGIAGHYITEDGRKASDVLDIQRAGIIPPDSNWSGTNEQGKPSMVVAFDAKGAPDIGATFGLHFFDRIVCHHLLWTMPAKPKLLVLLRALSSYCNGTGTITWSDEFSELTDGAVEYARFRGYDVQRRSQVYKRGHFWGYCTLAEARTYIAELLSGYAVTVRALSKEGQVLTMAKRR